MTMEWAVNVRAEENMRSGPAKGDQLYLLWKLNIGKFLFRAYGNIQVGDSISGFRKLSEPS
jgi:hypothetical protein